MSVADLSYSTSIDETLAALFPLPLTTLEAFMFADARPGYPMMCDIELELLGRVDRAAFDLALSFTLARNPLLACRVERVADGTLCWVQSGQRPAVQWTTLEAALDDSYGAPLDLTSQPGLRIWVRQGPETAKILFHMHHACSDAMGTFGFIGDLLARYAATFADAAPPTPRPIDPCRLIDRGNLGIAGRPWYRRLYDTIIGAREAARFFLLSPSALAPGERAGPNAPAPPRPLFITSTCSEHVTSGVRAAAAAAGATANDVLLRDLYIVLRRWNMDHGETPGRRPLRILMPQNLRSCAADYNTPAANIMGFAFVSRGAHWCDAPDELLASLSEETAAVRRGKLSLYFLGGLATLQARGLQSRVLDSQMVFATAVLTNLGDPSRRFGTRFARNAQGLAVVGNLVLSSLTAVPPLRPNTRAAFAVSNRGTTLAISLKWDPLYFSPLDAKELLGQYVSQLRATADRSDANKHETLARTGT